MALGPIVIKNKQAQMDEANIISIRLFKTETIVFQITIQTNISNMRYIPFRIESTDRIVECS